MNFSKILTIFSVVLLVLCAIGGVAYFLGWITEDPLMYFAYILIGITIFFSILGPIMFFIKNPSKAKSFLIGIGILILFLGISYGLASDELSKELVNDEISQTTVKYVDTGLIITYVLGIITVIAVLFSGIFTAIKKF